MKKERNVSLLVMLLNLIVGTIKLSGGIIFGFSTLIADSLQSLIDFITDIISSIASKVGRKRANKRYPFGYGMIENITNFIIGIILFGLGLFILIESFKIQEIGLSRIVFVVLIAAIILKLLVIYILYYYGKKLKSNILLTSIKESILDLIASLIVLIVSILLSFKEKYEYLKYASNIGSTLISLIIFYMAGKIIIENVRYLLGINEDNDEIKEKLKEVINKNKLVKDFSIKLMKMGNYYNLYLTIELETTATLKQLFSLENKLKKEIRNLNLKIKFIEIEPKEYD